MKIHLSKSELNYLRETLLEPIQKLGGEVYFFGSRVQGNHHEFSDVDTLIKSKDIPGIVKTVSGISENLEKGNFPYKVDIVFDEDLAESYRESVGEFLVLFG